MPIVFNSKLQSSVANATFLDKTIDQTMPYQLDLTDGGSTAVIDSQLQINRNKKVVFSQATITAGDTLTPDNESMEQEFRLIGDGATVALNALPFSSQPIDGTTIVLVGHSDTFKVTVLFNNVQYGCYINGDASLGFGNSITLKYNNEIERYVEIGRNF